MAQLGSELATLKAGIASAQRSSSTQFGKLTERLDRTEKAQAEPAAKLAKIQESIDRLEQPPAAAPRLSPLPRPRSPARCAPKEESKPQVAEGWRLRDFYDGRAVVESRNGTLFRVGPGSNVPGLGKVETIKRENGKVVVVTAERHHRGVARAAASGLLLPLSLTARLRRTRDLTTGGAARRPPVRISRRWPPVRNPCQIPVRRAGRMED